MRSPFPGMDPYLEDPVIWPGVHAELIGAIRALLVPMVRPRYYVDIQRRLYVCPGDDPAVKQIVPDLALLRGRQPGAGSPASSTSASSPVVLTMLDEFEFRESWIAIRAVDGKEAVTVIEVLSPANKKAHSHGRVEYLEKRDEILHSTTHLVEIDLLREGERFPSAVPLPRGEYYVHVSREPMRPKGQVWAIGLRDPLPTITIPLRYDDPDVPLDLGRALRETYERGGYDLHLNYAKPPVPPLQGEDVEWGAQVAGTAKSGG